MALEAFRATLRGLSGVNVQVEPVNADAEGDGLLRTDLQTDVESALREAGFEVVTQSRLFAAVPGTPVLHCDVMTAGFGERYVYSIRLELWQAVRLVRDPSAQALAVTWFAPQLIGMVTKESLFTLRQTVRSTVDEFVRDCRAAAA